MGLGREPAVFSDGLPYCLGVPCAGPSLLIPEADRRDQAVCHH
jgi:hypothetical protein